MAQVAAPPDRRPDPVLPLLRTISDTRPQPTAGRPRLESPLAPEVADQARSPWRWEHVSLLWRVFAANIVVFVVAFALLAWAPVTVHRVATPSELVILRPDPVT